MTRVLWALFACAILAPSPAIADQAVSVGGAMAHLNKPAAPRASAILIPGGDGALGVRPDGSFSGRRRAQISMIAKEINRFGGVDAVVEAVDRTAAQLRDLTSARELILGPWDDNAPI